jgi:hypothetical protein
MKSIRIEPSIRPYRAAQNGKPPRFWLFWAFRCQICYQLVLWLSIRESQARIQCNHPALCPVAGGIHQEFHSFLGKMKGSEVWVARNPRLLPLQSWPNAPEPGSACPFREASCVSLQPTLGAPESYIARRDFMAMKTKMETYRSRCSFHRWSSAFFVQVQAHQFFIQVNRHKFNIPVSLKEKKV